MVAVQVNTSVTGGQPDFIVQSFDLEDAAIPVSSRASTSASRRQRARVRGRQHRQGEYDARWPAARAPTCSTTTAGGVQLGDIGRRLAFAVRFRDVNLLISDNITSRSRLMFNRDIRDRVERAAPFLQWDGDPYAVVVDGKIKFVRDGYTSSNNYPYAQRVDLAVAARRNELGSRGVRGQGNYIRNSVKAVVDAYTGEVTLYAFDESDPLPARLAQGVPRPVRAQERDHAEWPSTSATRRTCSRSRPGSTPATTRRPGRLLLQGRLLGAADDRSGEIQRQEDSELTTAASVKARPYYLLTKLPGSKQPEFVLVMPFTPNGKENMVSYLAANSTRPTTARCSCSAWTGPRFSGRPR